jgi:signal transduction histidine kinase
MSVVVAVIGAISLIGWAIGIPLLVRIHPGFLAANPAAALTYILCALGLWVRARQGYGTDHLRPLVPIFLGGLVAVLGALTLLDDFFGTGGRIDQLLIRNKLNVYSPITANEAVCFLFCGVALMWFDSRTRFGFCPAQALVLVQGLIALLTLLSYGYRTLNVNKMAVTALTPFWSALASGLWTLGALAARPNLGVMEVISSRTTGGAMARRLLPMAVFVPVILAALWLLAEKRGYLEIEAGLSMFAVSTIIIFTGLIWWNARLLFKADLQRMRSERHLALQYKSARVLSDASDLQQAFPGILEAICQSIQWQAAVAWEIDKQERVLRCAAVWQSDSPKIRPFIALSKNSTFGKGAGLPGRVWASGKPIWIANVAEDKEFEQASQALAAGLQAAFAFPIRIGDEELGVIECFSKNVESRDNALLEMLSAIGNHIGQFIERHRAEDQLRLTSSELARSNTDLQQFAYVASHDLFEPLRMVISFLQLLENQSMGKLDKESNEFIHFAMDGARRMQALINDLLAFSRVDQRGQTMELVNCEDVLAAATNNLKVAIEESAAAINHTPLPTVRADLIQLIQLFQNLIGNAIKFHRAEAPRIDIAAKLENNEWVFSFRDNGIGIDPKYFNRIFEIFQRLHTRRDYAGTGMGLAICKRIVERHGGRIWVESAPGQGSTFYFTLPEVKQPQDAS